MESFLTQSENMVTIPCGATPVIYIATHPIGHVATRVAMGIAFLRSGCPAVQFFWVGINVRDDVLAVLDLLTLRDEERFEHTYTYHPLPSGNACKLIVTRHPAIVGDTIVGEA